MLKLLFKDAIKTPWKLLALCLVAYLASMSVIVFIFLALLGCQWVRSTIQKNARALASAGTESNRTEPASPVTPVTPATATVACPTPAASVGVSPSTPKRQYAKSAVVIPFRTGTRD